jgi:GWxTD domain-containing protein
VKALALALLLAVNLGRFQDWAASPQGYFMTKDERAAWSKLSSEGEAEAFVKNFIASRGPRFTEDVASLAADADRYLTVAGKKGSATMRGKIAIVLGRPTSVTIRPWAGDKSATMATHIYDGILTPKPAMNLPPSTERTSDIRIRYSTDYKLTYPKRTIIVAVDPITGDDRILDARMRRAVDAMLEAAAEAKRVNR